MFYKETVINCTQCGKFCSTSKNPLCEKKGCPAKSAWEVRTSNAINLQLLMLIALFILGTLGYSWLSGKYIEASNQLASYRKENTLLIDSISKLNSKIYLLNSNASDLNNLASLCNERCMQLNTEIDSIASIKRKVIYIEKHKENYSQCEIDCYQLQCKARNIRQ